MLCALCLRESVSPPNRVGGLDLCNFCAFGGALAAAKARGYQLEVDCFAIGPSRAMTFFARGDARLEMPALKASFRRRGFGSLLRRIFTRRVRLSDPLFHRIGHIESPERVQVLEFMDDEGVQGIVMELLGEDVNISIARNGRVKVRGVRTSGAFDRTRLELGMAVLMVHLDRFALRRRPTTAHPGRIRTERNPIALP